MIGQISVFIIHAVDRGNRVCSLFGNIHGIVSRADKMRMN